MWSEEWSVEYGVLRVWSVEYGVRFVEFGVRSLECRSVE